MERRLKILLFGIAGVMFGMVIGNVFRNGEVTGDPFGIILAIAILISLTTLGFHLYKKRYNK
ncbi:hypothetical protein NC661_14995 [Aquibacillus koreensis]|uniref:Uncharacterized protein n=1 Tax=Aquibacillus koreensis TaxID=279446 RepID=A0A9X3WMW0_9BACI|nr:hypothetical protein [Aquibacillus koreensis]MCT2534371.1 hypothetical protein [Aquibacillus koreensis]MDC3421678.1 hypothetical protein [Aquibacillus koreensis]